MNDIIKSYKHSLKYFLYALECYEREEKTRANILRKEELMTGFYKAHAPEDCKEAQREFFELKYNSTERIMQAAARLKHEAKNLLNATAKMRQFDYEVDPKVEELAAQYI